MQSETRQALIGWIRHFGLLMVIYIAALGGATWVLRSMAAGPLKTALVMAPVLPGLALIGMTIRVYGRCEATGK